MLNRLIARQRNRLAKLLAGLPLGGEAVWPGERNDLFAAHDSVYRFARQFAAGRRVLDAACGTGYGSALLAEVAASVIGIDQNRARVLFARRHYSRPNLRFKVGDLERYESEPESLDLCVSSNTLEHLVEPRAFLRSVGDALAEGGELLIVVPPVYSELDVAANEANRFHLTNRSVESWMELFEQEGWAVTPYRHSCSRPLDFTSPLPSAAVESDFSFVQVPRDEICASPSLSATFVLRRPDV